MTLSTPTNVLAFKPAKALPAFFLLVEEDPVDAEDAEAAAAEAEREAEEEKSLLPRPETDLLSIVPFQQ